MSNRLKANDFYPRNNHGDYLHRREHDLSQSGIPFFGDWVRIGIHNCGPVHGFPDCQIRAIIYCRLIDRGCTSNYNTYLMQLEFGCLVQFRARSESEWRSLYFCSDYGAGFLGIVSIRFRIVTDDPNADRWDWDRKFIAR